MKLSSSLDSLSPQRRASMLAAAREIRECYRVLEKAGINLVGEVLRGQGEFRLGKRLARREFKPENARLEFAVDALGRAAWTVGAPELRRSRTDSRRF